MDYTNYAKVMKAMSEPKRVKILDLLSCGTLCACDVLNHFDFTQPTLSHHIKVLVEAELVTAERKGTWHYYSIKKDSVEQLLSDTKILFSSDKHCICVTEENQKKDNQHIELLEENDEKEYIK
ncbi:ArsR family transcriptional regulator [Jeotgalibaca ciconiae]|uniref:ArsR family transcriptional regulator n=2 Tax=Jeotgalibaca ciconiae TaxID=2496265 RepID=A0A3Q9BJE5_9LACT|nr:ArsR family transcriptional regulator [Jeotgalibaca ciconiae]